MSIPSEAASRSRQELTTLSHDELVDLVLRFQQSEAPDSSQSVPKSVNNNKRKRGSESEDDQGDQPGRRLTKKQRKGKVREMDWSKWSLRHIALHVAYLGWDYRGLAQQSPSDDTIEGKLFDALRLTKLIPDDATWGSVHYSRCGRTDKGVSAFGQVVAFHLRSKVTAGKGIVKVGNVKKDKEGEENSEIDFVAALNRVLPSNIRVLGWCPVDLDFSARFSTVKRTYKYLFIRGKLNLESMRAAAAHFKGEHDFRNFCKIDVAKVKHFRRVVFDISIAPLDVNAFGDESDDSALFAIVVEGTAFLWHQIRCMVAILFMVGNGHETPNIVSELLDVTKNNRKPIYEMASEIPLILYSAEHTGIEWIRPEDGLNIAKRDLADNWSESYIKSGIYWAMLQGLETRPSLVAPKPHQLRHTPLAKREKEKSFEDKLAHYLQAHPEEAAMKESDEAEVDE